jgi:regulation of enolase protein 1 (concanavalin A-like superfamily)
MPENIQAVIATIGAIAFFAGLFGGFKAKDIEISALPLVLRIVSFVIGIIFIGIAVWPFVRDQVLVSPTPTSLTAPPTNTPISKPTDEPMIEPVHTSTSKPGPTPTNTPVPKLPTTTPTLGSSIVFHDDFGGTLADDWGLVREVSTHWSLTAKPGFWRITLQPGGTGNLATQPPNNVLLRKAPGGNFEIATLVYFTPTSNYQFAGLIIYQDDSNAVQFGRAFCNVADICVGNGIYFDNTQSGKNYATAISNPSKVYLRLQREGTTYTGYYSEDGTNWTMVGQHTNNLNSLRVGLIATQAYESETTADFDYFTIKTLP